MNPSPEAPDADEPGADQTDALARFRNWHGFLVAALAVNALFVWAMLGHVQDPAQRIWLQSLVWLPFNAIATAVYYAVMQRLGGLYRAICLALIAANWLLLFLAGR